MKQSYTKVLEALLNGAAKSSVELARETQMERFDVVGAISILRRNDALAQAGNGKYRITDRGIMLLGTQPSVQVSPRSSQ
ncbi:MAG: hypothetical protein JRN34_05065 [Nitrososphaerota archaeon]|jgi:hypothetical protein|nr:hypothetical protein [Nitrososphaerota archaeon]MDG6942279.1 hypothetical protein [Nitrososphaerota archaeon]MDG6942744.1 hypothetical protein [Nitrososphaerota archaeon]MDG6948531.1 hypothetical protein [Nitrososphaerota archaeon]MDG6950457.1 hypothetical protein [Nitrososphaerota archaeon]